MAEIRDQLVLDIDQAQRQIDSLGRSIDRALSDVEVRIDDTSAREFEAKLLAVERSAGRLNTELTAASLSMGRAELDARQLADALGVSETEARQLAAELLESQASANRTEDAARDVARQLGLAEDEADRFVRSLQRAGTEAKDIDVSARTMVGSFGQLRTVVGGVVAALGAIGVGRGIAALARGASSAVQSFAKLNESVNAVSVTFEDADDIIFAFGQTSARAAGLSQASFQQAVVPIGSVLRNFGFDAREAANASIELVQRAADLASVFNTDVNDALIAINAALVGQVEPLRRYGAEVSVARAQQFALAEGLAETRGEIDQSVLTQARLGLILADTNRVAGDFTNTIGDYANASRAAQADFENFTAELGENLLPIFETILQQAPPILDFFRSLSVEIGTLADDSVPALQALPDIISGIFLGLGQLADTAGLFIDAAQGFPAVIEDIAAGLVDGDASFSNFNAQLDQFTQRRANSLIRVASQQIPAALRLGDDAATAFANSIAFLGRQSDSLNTVQQSFGRLAAVAGLTGRDLQAVTQFLIDNAEAANLNADEIEFLRDVLVDLDVATVGTEPRLLQMAAAAREAAAAFDHTAPRFTAFVDQVEEGTGDLSTFAGRIQAASSEIAEALNPFDEATEAIDVSGREFFENLVTQVEEQATFQAGLARLVASGFGDLAGALAEQGPGVQDALNDFLEDNVLAGRAEALLDGKGTEAARLIGDALTRELGSTPLSQEAAAAFETLVSEGIFTNSQVLQAIQTGTANLGRETQTGYRDALAQEEAALAASTQETITRAFDEVNAELAASGLISHLQEVLSNVQFRINTGQLIVPDIIRPDVIDRRTSSTAGSVNVVVNNPVSTDPQSSIQRGVQIAGAISGSLVGFS